MEMMAGVSSARLDALWGGSVKIGNDFAVLRCIRFANA